MSVRTRRRLGDRDPRTGGGGALRQTVPDVRVLGPLPVSPRHCTCPTPTSRTCAPACGPSATCSRQASRRPASRSTARPAPTSSPPTSAPSARATASPSAALCRKGAGSWPYPTPSSTTTATRGHPSCASRSARGTTSSTRPPAACNAYGPLSDNPEALIGKPSSETRTAPQERARLAHTNRIDKKRANPRITPRIRAAAAIFNAMAAHLGSMSAKRAQLPLGEAEEIGVLDDQKASWTLGRGTSCP